MKIFQKILILALCILFTQSAQAQKNKTEKVTFKVFGNCPQCESRITDACDLKGVKSAEWDVDTKMMTLIYNPNKITVDKVQDAIAASGHDTETKKAPDEVYSKLPDCCLYREKPNTHHD
jgi:copper chaperone CopZ